MTPTQKNLNQFLRKELANKVIGKFILRHASQGAKGHAVETFEITEAIEFDQIATFADMIIAAAQSDADGMGPQVQRYVLVSFTKDGDESARQVFRLRGEADSFDETEAGEEPPTQRGHLAQLMRHNEATNRALVGSFSTMLNSMNRRMENQDRTIERLVEDREKGWKALEDARSMQHERDMHRMEIEYSEKRKDKAFDKMALLLPALLSHFTKGAIPSKTDPMSIAIQELIGSMSIEQLNAIRSSLGPEQQIVLFKIVQTFQQNKQAQLPESPNGEPKTVS
jgi:hypothetical protein